LTRISPSQQRKSTYVGTSLFLLKRVWMIFMKFPHHLNKKILLRRVS
jgi:hypothetical protein